MLGWLAAGWKGEPRWDEAAAAAHREGLRAAWLTGRTE